MRLLITLFLLNCLIFIQAEEPTTIQPALTVELLENDQVPDNSVEIRNGLANKPFFTITDSKSTTERRDEKKQSTTTNRPKLSVYALINAKKETKRTKAGKCNCFGEAASIVRYIKVLNDELELGDGGNLDCALPTEASNRCEQLCKDKAIQRFGDDVDLKKPYSLKDEKVSIGQELCRQVGSIILPSSLKIKSHIVCPGQKLATYRDTGLKSKQKFVCLLGRLGTIAG